MFRIDAHVYIGLGCNAGVKKSLILWAIRQINKFSAICDVSPFYYNRAQINKNAPNYLNAVVVIQTRLSPLEVLKKLQLIERRCGRPFHRVKNSSRRCDLDILYYNDEIIKSAKLIIPHPGRLLRDFVLLPLSFINPKFKDPVSKRELWCEAKYIYLRKYNLNSYYCYAPFVHSSLLKQQYYHL